MEVPGGSFGDSICISTKLNKLSPEFDVPGIRRGIRTRNSKGCLIRTDLARPLAETLGARYFTFETLRAEGITTLARI